MTTGGRNLYFRRYIMYYVIKIYYIVLSRARLDSTEHDILLYYNMADRIRDFNNIVMYIVFMVLYAIIVAKRKYCFL